MTGAVGSGMTTSVGMSATMTLSMSQLPVLAVEVLKQSRPRLVFPVSTVVPSLAVAARFRPYIPTNTLFMNTAKLFAPSVRTFLSGPM